MVHILAQPKALRIDNVIIPHDLQAIYEAGFYQNPLCTEVVFDYAEKAAQNVGLEFDSMAMDLKTGVFTLKDKRPDGPDDYFAVGEEIGEISPQQVMAVMPPYSKFLHIYNRLQDTSKLSELEERLKSLNLQEMETILYDSGSLLMILTDEYKVKIEY